ncbi:MAG TPA: hypothetical protein VHE55_01555 [Fimbriimonadaceae bacterium]|nr:hypothetical protein [Fimbriimonadaceae bacterium]
MLQILVASVLQSSAAWGSMMAKLCAKPAKYAAVLKAGDHAYEPMLRWFEAAGVRAKLDSYGRQVPGLVWDIFQDKKIMPVAGCPGACLLLLYQCDSHGRQDEFSHLELFRLRRGRLEAQAIQMSGAEDPLPRHAAMVDGTIFAVGTVNWFGNAPSAVLAKYQLSGGRWKVTSRLESKFEVVQLPRITVIRSGRMMPLRVISRTYTDSLNLCHATAQVEMEEQWSVRGGKLHRDWTRRPTTAFNRFVDLVELLRSGHVRSARAYCASQAVYLQVKRLRVALTGNAGVTFKNGIDSVDGVDFGLREVCMLHWIRQRGKWVIGRVTTG